MVTGCYAPCRHRSPSDSICVSWDWESCRNAIGVSFRVRTTFLCWSVLFLLTENVSYGWVRGSWFSFPLICDLSTSSSFLHRQNLTAVSAFHPTLTSTWIYSFGLASFSWAPVKGSQTWIFPYHRHPHQMTCWFDGVLYCL